MSYGYQTCDSDKEGKCTQILSQMYVPVQEDSPPPPPTHPTTAEMSNILRIKVPDSCIERNITSEGLESRLEHSLWAKSC